MNIEPEHDQREKDVLNFFTGSAGEISGIVAGKFSPRPQLILCFSLIDMLASYWYEYLGKSGTQKSRFIEWWGKYCATSSNQSYNGNSLSSTTSTRLYELRCSLVHFFGLSAKNENTHFILAHNEIKPQRFEKVAHHVGYQLVTIVPSDFFQIIKDGSELMLTDWIRNIALANQGSEEALINHTTGIERIWAKIQTEGAIQMKRELLEKVEELIRK